MRTRPHQMETTSEKTRVIKKNQIKTIELKRTIAELKFSLERAHRICELAEGKNRELDVCQVGLSSVRNERRKNEDKLTEPKGPWDTIGTQSQKRVRRRVCVMGVTEGEERGGEKGYLKKEWMKTP